MGQLIYTLTHSMRPLHPIDSCRMKVGFCRVFKGIANDFHSSPKLQTARSNTAENEKQPQNAFNPTKLDLKWQKHLVSNAKWPGLAGSQTKPTMYVLPMFPYPSGSLHMGHARVYTISDVFARFYRLQRMWRVRHAIGWDSFGLPAENAARACQVHPATWVSSNVEAMTKQLRQLHISFDWHAEDVVDTSQPAYYKHTQALFLALHAQGLAYRALSRVNWDPVDRTVLADEQVDLQGRSWRSGAPVQSLLMQQWFFATTAFADDLLEDEAAGSLAQWPKTIVNVQRRWIGKKEGAEGAQNPWSSAPPVWRRFKADSVGVRGVQWDLIVLEAEDVSADSAAATGLQAFCLLGDGQPEGLAAHPVASGHVHRLLAESLQSLPGKTALLVEEIWVAALNARVSLFCRSAEVAAFLEARAAAGLQDGGVRIVSAVVLPQNMASLGAAADGRPQAASHRFRMRDWLVSRQRFWGTPIPIVYCDGCGTVPVRLEDLPVVLPQNSYAPLETNEAWRRTVCPRCGAPDALRESDTLDTFVDSSWYWARLLDPANDAHMFSPSAFRPVDVYVGGAEHAKTHLLYARFIHKFLARTLSLDQTAAPFKHIVAQGVVCGKTFKDASTGQYVGGCEATARHPSSVRVSWEKMSKSKFNGTDPSLLVEANGADVVRLAVLFATTPDMPIEWQDHFVVGHRRWIRRLFDLFRASSGSDAGAFDAACSPFMATAFKEFLRTLSITNAVFEHQKHPFNKAIASFMNLSNVLSKASSEIKTSHAFKSILRRYAVIMHPFIPCTSAELYETVSKSLNVPHSLESMEWPSHDALLKTFVEQRNFYSTDESLSAGCAKSFSLVDESHQNAQGGQESSKENVDSRHSLVLCSQSITENAEMNPPESNIRRKTAHAIGTEAEFEKRQTNP